jgi:hypothetical protein
MHLACDVASCSYFNLNAEQTPSVTGTLIKKARTSIGAGFLF